MSQPSERDVLEALRPIQDPDFKRSIVDLGFVKNLRIDAGKVSFAIELTTPACPVKERFQEEARAAVGKLAVASGKGGVGKSTLAVNLALALAETGAKVGLLDCDVYGPSIPLMLHISGRPQVTPDKKIHPLQSYGLKLMSIGFLAGENAPVIWRGPMVHGIIRQFLSDVKWGELDYLVLDLPPGTGDAALTICQTAPLAGAVIVTTPQEVALIDARKGLQMFQRVNVPVLGIVENMSYFICDGCEKRHTLFGEGARSGGGGARHRRARARAAAARRGGGRRRGQADHHFRAGLAGRARDPRDRGAHRAQAVDAQRRGAAGARHQHRVGEHALMKVVRWDESATAFSPEKMKKVGLFETEHFFLDLYCLEPGQSQKPHAHEGCHKVYLVVEGRGKVRVGGEERALASGEAAMAGSGEVHGIENDSDARLVVLTFMSPPPGKHS
jgi:ATP-binding protein involved in chromosome partitioning